MPLHSGVRRHVLTGSVNHTALSAIEAGFETGIYTPCIAGIDPQGSKAALDGLKMRGGVVIDDESSLSQFIE
jgi:nicotinamidase-related amidase